ncbi:tRNA (cytosine(32)/uridine(32)-2'-O)-methyltransferase TrmJ [Legionella pneumophila serogroup 1]|uniref:tRNA (cytosine(32)/uridine(32)-2'-O)-methyltransferase TrmJ n=1 Tax=Legionella pneumophila TaxID=446 RepID=UPI000778617F|nr:tRNA (cytosine(32)/uridine(32)-2'-O)-methyltransferase TrmJ [Legionella pneumophila]HCC3236072.1 tRNA (cytosine(32)/uridine(32)-2'-O)-methyltransferase TrmJ [Legionella pneumophila subsp. pneumophila]HAT8621679.1 tRNA (cytosine(32)/uridine(32)-2'-O)-methyltransferase TrmJ [Legionella pneumophila]HAU9854337.1 tRNA (cytosine(32)/uridine(32)-2'-O)-methyltransferase TrmJ [Legionella pneumophila]HAU9907735.1 tRNA (cytosine(32)/uridine(32)-2'-O)-methyltransferase TrmJ [Legionella pneumophila]HAV0
MKLSSIRIVLVSTSHPGNIGSTARAMKTMGLSTLYLVNPKSFPDLKAKEMAAGADDVLDAAVVTNTLDEALIGCQLILGTSARPRGLSLPGLIPASCAELINQQLDNTQVAIVFGREHAGLTNEELLKCHYHINIPSNPEYSSLNLAQAVQIIAYELRMKLLSPSAQVALRNEEPATADEIEQFYEHLKEVFIEINFLKPSNPRRLMQRVRRLFNRINLEKMEVSILRGMLSQVQKSLEWARKDNRSNKIGNKTDLF